ncbi:hypothetical protein, partial [Chitinimonas sp.]|uniref:hypothetical protein n=1 Tax=Chitinimonas sp. TaxID=1934313 RepID=UPI0035AF16F5
KVFSGSTQNVVVDPSGLIRITGTPSAPLQLQVDAPPKAVIELPYNVPIPISVTLDGHVVTFRSISKDETGRLIVRSALFGSRLAYFSGRFQIDALKVDTIFPVNDDDKPALLRTTTPGSSFVYSRNDGFRRYFLGAGKAQLESNSGDVKVPLFGGETVIVAPDGNIDSILVGSPDATQGVPGDPLAINNLDSNTVVPKLSGTLPRLGDSKGLLDVVKTGLDARFSTTGSISYDDSTGVVSYTAGGKTRRFLPVGQPSIPFGNFPRADSGSCTSSSGSQTSGSFCLAASGINQTMSTSLAYFADLDSAVKALDAKGKVVLQSNGVIKVTLAGSDYYTSAGGAVTAGTASNATPTFLTDISGYIGFKDRTASTQILYPVFADDDTVSSVVQSVDAAGTYTNNGDGSAQATISGQKLTLTPVYNLISAPAAHANDLYWQDGANFYIRYSDDTAQQFSIK